MTHEQKIELSPGIYLRLVPSTPYVLEGVENRLYLLIELSADEKEQTLDRPPYNLAMVLDRSGSMSGEKLKYAKEATKLILDNIHSNDLLHLVTYDDTIKRVFVNGTQHDKQNLLRKIDLIQSGNTTNISGGLVEAQEILKEYGLQEQSKRIFLFSDGLANVGITSEDAMFNLVGQLHRQGMNTTSFGIGQDFNELMMTGIAEHGRGDYFFIENADSIPHIVEEAIQGLLETVATNVIIRIRGVNNSLVTKLYLHDVMKGAVLGDLRSGETRRMVAEVKVDPSKLGNGEFVKAEVEYRLADDLINPITQEHPLKISSTKDESQLQENDEVLTFKVQSEVAEREQEIYEHLSRREFDRAQQINQMLLGQLQNTTFRDDEGLIADKLENLEDMVKYIDNAKKRNDARSAMKRSYYSSYMTRSGRTRNFKEKFDDKD